MSVHFRDFKVLSQQIVFAFIALLGSVAPVQAGGVDITSYGHSSLFIRGAGKTVLLNPFKSVGCAEGLKEPRVRANVILASSVLEDEGARVAKGVFLVEPGSYRIYNLKFESFQIPHDRLGGRRFGQSTVWQWKQAGLSFVHLGGSAAPLTAAHKVLLGRPDVLIIAVGGGTKVYNGVEAAKIVRSLNPKVVIPVQYLNRTVSSVCDLTGVQPFLDAMQGTKIREVGKTFSISRNSYKKTVIKLIR